MEKIRLGSGKELELIACGILAAKDTLTLKFLPGEDSLDDINTFLMDTSETAKMTLLSESGEALAIYNGYTELQSISQNFNAVIGYTQDEEPTEIIGKLVTAVLCKPDQTDQRLTSVEDQVTDLQLAMCEIYEGTV